MTDQLIYGLNVFNVTPSLTTNSMEAQLGDIIRNAPESDTAQWVQHVGFCSLPTNPIPGSTAAETLTYRSGQRDFIFASREISSQSLYGTMTAGETALYSSGNSGSTVASTFLKTDATINLYTTDNGLSTGGAVTFVVGPQGVAFNSSFASWSIDPSGMHFSHTSGCSFDFGNMVSPTNSCFNFTGGSFVANTGTVTLGASITGLYGPCAVPLPGFSFGPFVPVIGVGVGTVDTNIAGSPQVMIAYGG